MTCKQCEKQQNAVMNEEESRVHFVNVGSAQVMLVGCPIHVKWATELIRRGKREEQNDETGGHPATGASN